MAEEGFTIGRLARDADVNIETIRYYERIGLMEKPRRTRSERRLYNTVAAQRLRFIRRARGLGFSIEEIRTLLSLSAGKGSCAEVYDLTARHLADVRAKIADLKRLESTLSMAAKQCTRDSSTDCAIIDALSGEG